MSAAVSLSDGRAVHTDCCTWESRARERPGAVISALRRGRQLLELIPGGVRVGLWLREALRGEDLRLLSEVQRLTSCSVQPFISDTVHPDTERRSGKAAPRTPLQYLLSARIKRENPKKEATVILWKSKR